MAHSEQTFPIVHVLPGVDGNGGDTPGVAAVPLQDVGSDTARVAATSAAQGNGSGTLGAAAMPVADVSDDISSLLSYIGSSTPAASSRARACASPASSTPAASSSLHSGAMSPD